MLGTASEKPRSLAIDQVVISFRIMHFCTSVNLRISSSYILKANHPDIHKAVQTIRKKNAQKLKQSVHQVSCQQHSPDLIYWQQGHGERKKFVCVGGWLRGVVVGGGGVCVGVGVGVRGCGN